MATLSVVKYESDGGDIHSMKLTSDYAAAAGDEPTDGVSSDIKPKISKTNREHGLRPRGVRLVRTIGTAPDTFKKYTFLPVLTAAQWVSGAFAPGSAINIGSTAYTVIARIAEDY